MSYLQDKIQELAEYNVILVTGPQRSGTQIASRIIAHELEYTYLDEGRFNVWDISLASNMAVKFEPCVLQGPGLLRKVPRFMMSFQGRKAAAVLIRRDSNSIVASLERLPAVQERVLVEWPEALRSPNPYNCLPTLMYFFWDLRVVGPYQDVYEIDYYLFREHEFWVPDEEREGWKSKQWKK